MSTATDSHAAESHATDIHHASQDDIAHEAASHDKQYWIIAGILAVMTAVEVALSYMDIPTGVEIGGLLGLMVLKFVLVVLYFMHLKFDSKLFSRLFYTGVFLALAVYIAALASFHFFASS